MTFQKKSVHTKSKQNAMPTQEILPPVKEDKRKSMPHLWGKGVSGNPNGRPVGARSRLADAFIKDVLADWEEHGIEALEECRKEDPSTYLRVVASIVPKDINIREGESTLEAYLSQFTGEQIDQLLAGLAAIGAQQLGTRSEQVQITAKARSKPNGVH